MLNQFWLVKESVSCCLIYRADALCGHAASGGAMFAFMWDLGLKDEEWCKPGSISQVPPTGQSQFQR